MSMPKKRPLCDWEQSTEKWWAGFCAMGFMEFFRVLSMSGMDLTVFHISKRITAQIREYSIVHGKRNGDSCWTKAPIIVVREHPENVVCVGVATVVRLLTVILTSILFIVLSLEWFCILNPVLSGPWTWRDWFRDGQSGPPCVPLCSIGSRPWSISWWFMWNISCFVSSTRTYNHSHKFVATMCMSPKREVTLWRAMSIYVVLRKMNCTWAMQSTIRQIGVMATKTSWHPGWPLSSKNWPNSSPEYTIVPIAKAIAPTRR